MGNPFSTTSVTSYNTNPPPDDGSHVSSNLGTWAGVKTKLGDPIKTAFDTSETSTQTAFGKIPGGAGITTTAVDYTVGASDQGKLIKVTASGKTLTTPDATIVGAPFLFRFVNESTGNITIDGSGTQTIDGALTVTVPAGCGGSLDTDGTNWFTNGQNFTNTQIAPVPGNFKNLSIKVASNTTVTASADYVVTTNGSGKFHTTAVSSTINLGTSGVVDALDTGTIAIDSWYYIWVIVQSDGTTKCIASLQSTANATFLANLAAIASGVYTYYARIGAVQTIHGSATLYGTWQFGRRAQYVVGLAQTTVLPNIVNGIASSTYSATSPTLVAASVSRFVPPTASRIDLMTFNDYQGGLNSAIIVAPNASYSGANNGPSGSAGMGSFSYNISAATCLPLSLLLESTNIYYASSAAGGAVSAIGWEDNI